MNQKPTKKTSLWKTNPYYEKFLKENYLEKGIQDSATIINDPIFQSAGFTKANIGTKIANLMRFDPKFKAAVSTYAISPYEGAQTRQDLCNVFDF